MITLCCLQHHRRRATPAGAWVSPLHDVCSHGSCHLQHVVSVLELHGAEEGRFVSVQRNHKSCQEQSFQQQQQEVSATSVGIQPSVNVDSTEAPHHVAGYHQLALKTAFVGRWMRNISVPPQCDINKALSLPQMHKLPELYECARLV